MWFMIKKELSSVIVHTHSRLGSSFLSKTEAERENGLQDSSFTLDSLLKIAKRLSKDDAVILCDADHPAHALDIAGVSRDKAYAAIKTNQSVRLVIDSGVSRRAEIVRSLGNNFLTGVEANILDNDGTLDVSDKVLEQLDVVVASFHYSYWKRVTGAKPSLQDYIRAAEKVVSNPNVDVLGHPFRDAERNGLSGDLLLWMPLLEKMAASGVAYELNLSYFVNSGITVQELLVIAEGAKRRINFALGWDFHNFDVLGEEFSHGLIDTDFSTEEVLRGLTGVTKHKFLKRLVLVLSTIEKCGVEPDFIVNSSKIRFGEWLDNRNKPSHSLS